MLKLSLLHLSLKVKANMKDNNHSPRIKEENMIFVKDLQKFESD